MTVTVADFLTKALASAGVKRIWGVTGDGLNGINESLRRNGSLQWMHVRDEEVAALAAGADAARSGQLGVCAGSYGPGNLHLVDGLFDCQRSHLPVLAIAAHTPSSEIGLGYFQETDPRVPFRECSQLVELVTSPQQLPGFLHQAMLTALGTRGVAVIVLSRGKAILDARGDELVGLARTAVDRQSKKPPPHPR